MGFDIRFECADRGASGEIPLALVKGRLAPYAHFGEDGCATFAHRDGGRGEPFASEKGANASGFMVARPPVHPEFWRAVLELRQKTTGFLWWPGLETPVVANPVTRDHLPKDRVKGLGEPTIVTAGEQILEAIRKS